MDSLFPTAAPTAPPGGGSDDGGLDATDILLVVFILDVAVCVGVTLTLEEFKRTMSNPAPVFIGWVCQFGIMPLYAFACIKAANIDPTFAIGVLLAGSAPGGSTSNLFTYWSNGNVALSICMSVASTICALFMMPFLAFVYLEKGLNSDSVEIPFTNIILSLLLILVPCAIALFIRYKNTTKKIGGLFIWQAIEKVASVLGALFLIWIFVEGISDNLHIFREASSTYRDLWIVAAFFQPAGCAAGYGFATLLNQTNKDCRTIAIETGVQNFALVYAVIQLSFTEEEGADVEAFVVIAALWYILNSAWIVLLFRYLGSQDNASSTNKEDGGKGSVQLASINTEAMRTV